MQHKGWSRFRYYLLNTAESFLSPAYFKRKKQSCLDYLNEVDWQAISQRLAYYHRPLPFYTPEESFLSLSEIRQEHRSRRKQNTFYFDLLTMLNCFPDQVKVSYIFGDIHEEPNRPTLVKYRPIQASNDYSVLYPFNRVRLSVFVDDPVPYSQKSSRAVWRGKAHQAQRKGLLEKFYKSKEIDVGNTLKTYPHYRKPFMSMQEQLKSKVIISLQGYDIASNITWAMSSNSLCFMPKPKYEAWFMEGQLQANRHYVELADDFSDLQDKFDYYMSHEDEALEIIHNANSYAAQFRDARLEKLLTLLVLMRFFVYSQQQEYIEF